MGYRVVFFRCAFLACLATTTAKAQFVYIEAYVSHPPASYSNSFYGKASDLATNLFGGVVDTGNAVLAMEAGFGILRSRNSIDASSPGAPPFATSSCVAEWSDFLTIVPANSSLNNQTATIRVSFSIAGQGYAFADGTNTASSRYQFNCLFNGNSPGTFDGTWSGNNSFSGFPPSNAITNWTFNVTLGQSFPISSYIRTETSYDRSGSTGIAHAWVDFARGYQWLTIDEVRVGSEELTEFTIQTDSGNDWLSIAEQPSPQITDITITNGQVYVVINGLSIAYTNQLEASPDITETNWSTVKIFENATGATGEVINLPSGFQILRVLQD